MIIVIIFLIFSTVAIISYLVIPLIYDRYAIMSLRRQHQLTNSMEQLMARDEAQKRSRMFIFAPFILAGLGYYFSPEGLGSYGAIFGFTAGLILPSIYINVLTKKTRDKFSDQLIDALMIMSSSFRGGLSLVQAIEAVVEEMPNPIRKEFGTVLGENKMGVSMDEALFHLYNRLPSSAVQQMITAILLARETGGNLPVIFNRIVTNIREAKKIQQNLDTLTIQGKIQGAVMSMLPIAFAFIVYNANRRIFNHMLESDLGRSMLIYAVISETIGAYLVWKISTNKEY
ncbi:MAG: type II secretion system F family protein [Candidatus Omnitrophica bacterium]|nr:type II secretion system F family protein [Candidatus Omnitrophota bacterium]MCB9747068.1 type II secretion system F family protein [Candidatus Omnitrophota bacterium]